MATRDSTYDPSGAPTPRLLSDEQRFNWLHLIRTRNVGPVTFWRLINHYGGAEQALQHLPAIAQRGGKKIRFPITREMVERELKAARRCGATLVAKGEPGYPMALAHIDAPPPLLYLKGNIELANQPCVAIVGSRNASAIGQKFTRTLVTELSKEGYCVVSGLARGIDTAAHEGAPDKASIAVIAGGIDNYYPPQNKDLQRQIEQDGLVISENPPGFEPQARDFPRRNRIISGSSLGTVVIEANLRSGSLITARLASEQGREVMAVPGHPFDPRASGPNRLILNGASLIRGAKDVIDILTPMSTIKNQPPPSLFDNNEIQREILDGDDDVEQSARDTVLNALSIHAVEIDEIIRSTGLPTRTVTAVLLELQIAEKISNEGAQKIRLVHRTMMDSS